MKLYFKIHISCTYVHLMNFDHIFKIIKGWDLEQQIKENCVHQLHHFPSGTSSKTIVHYAQMIENGEFCGFDYGESGNLEHYQQKYPPNVNLSLTTAPMALYLSKTNDFLVQPGDYERSGCSSTSNLKEFQCIESKYYESSI